MAHSDQADQANGVNYVVHIGAGTGAEVPGYLAAGLDPIILVEADPQTLVYLRALEQQYDAVQVIEAAVSSRADAQLFYRSNFPDLSALARPGEALKELFPGVKILGQEPVVPMDPVMVLQKCSLSADQSGLLVIEAPGEALGILEALKEAGMLSRFTEIRAQEGLVPLYEGAPGLDELRAALEALDYTVTQEPQPEDPDRPYLLARRVRLSVEASQMLQALTVALQDSEAALAVQREENEAVTVQLRLKLALIDGMLAEQGAQTQRFESAEAEAADLRATLDAQRQARESAEAEAADLCATLDAQRQARESAEAEATDLRATLEEQRQARASAESEAAGLHREAAVVRNAAEELLAEKEAEFLQKLQVAQQEYETKLTDLTARGERVQQDLAVALRMQDLRETDLRELQLRYGELKTRKEAQDSLLRRVQVSLSHQLQAPSAAPAALSAPEGEAAASKPAARPAPASRKVGDKKKRSSRSKKSTGA